MKKLEIITGKEKRRDKTRRMCTFLVDNKGDFFSHTNVAKEIQTHPDDVKEFANLFDTMKEAGFQSIRDKNGKLLKIGVTDDFLDLIKEIREIKREILDLKKGFIDFKNMFDEMKRNQKK